MFNLSEDQEKTLKECLEAHNKDCVYTDPFSQGAIGGRLSYTFTPTSLGVIAKVSCACGWKYDLTDSSDW